MGVDAVSHRKFWDLIYVADRGTTVLVTTHYMEEAEYCDRLGIMLADRLVATGAPAELMYALLGPASTRHHRCGPLMDSLSQLNGLSCVVCGGFRPITWVAALHIPFTEP